MSISVYFIVCKLYNERKSMQTNIVYHCIVNDIHLGRNVPNDTGL